MATQGAEDPATIPSTSDTTQTAAPVEMDTLQSSSEQLPHPVDRIDPQQSMAQPSDDPETTTTAAAATAADPAHPQPSSQQPQPTLTRKETEALGPATETAITQPTSAGPVLSITLMLTTGARHPYKIDEKYLKNRNCEAHAKDGTFEPRELSGYKLKELIWTDWRSEWEPRPAAPSSIRLIIWGKMVDDKKCLSGMFCVYPRLPACLCCSFAD